MILRGHGDDLGGEPRLQGAAEHLGQVHVDDPLGAAKRFGGLSGEALGQLSGLRHQIIGGDRTAGQAQLDGGGRGNAITGEEVFARAHDGCQQRPHRGTTVARHQADGHVRVGQVRRLGDEHDVGQQGHAAAQADRGSVDRRDHRQRETQHLLDDLRTLAHALVAGDGIVQKRCDPVQIAAGTECPPGAGDDHHLRRGVCRQLPPDVGQRPVQILVDAVELGGAVDDDGAHGAVGLDGQLVGKVVFHRVQSRQPARAGSCGSAGRGWRTTRTAAGAAAGCSGTATTTWSRRRTRPRRAAGGTPGTPPPPPRWPPSAAPVRRRAASARSVPMLHSAYLARISRPLRSTSASVSWNCTPWNDDSGWPNCLRRLTCAVVSSMARSSIPSSVQHGSTRPSATSPAPLSSTADSSSSATNAGPAAL